MMTGTELPLKTTPLGCDDATMFDLPHFSALMELPLKPTPLGRLGRNQKNVRRRSRLSNVVSGQTPLYQLHVPVLIKEMLANLICEANQSAVYFDCTVGMGGHSEAILKATGPFVKVFGIDQDEEAIAFAGLQLVSFQDRIRLIHDSFKNVGEIANDLGFSEVNGILFDCGVSSMQLTSPQRGFSFAMSGPLDMRMDQRLSETAADIVNTLPEKALADLIYRYGEERASRRIASAIVRYRENEGPIIRTDCLAEIIDQVVYKKSKGKRIHPATKTFQALRICVNDELNALEEGLSHAIALLAVGGKLVVISFHSLEDRIVKQCFKAIAKPEDKNSLNKKRQQGDALPSGEGGKRFQNLYKKPIIPTPEEMAQNPRARSAKLRVLERVE